MISRFHTGAFVLLALLLAAGGCSRALTTSVANPIEIDITEYGRIYRASLDVLHDNGFILDRTDYRFGRISTRPQVSPTLFEPWIQINSTSYQSVQSTINDQRRIVWVRIDPIRAPEPVVPAAQSPKEGSPAKQPILAYRLSVEVDIEQAQLPNRRLGGSTAGPGIINTLAAMPTEYRVRGIEAPYWEPVARDSYLEQRILAAVVRLSVERAEHTESGSTTQPAQPSEPGPSSQAPLIPGAVLQESGAFVSTISP